MNIIKVGATDSTNLHLKRMLLDEALPDYTVLVTDAQLMGRGQAGNKWLSQPGKNLTLSILKKMEVMPVSSQFLISMASSLAIINSLKNFQIPELSIKWPNDIMSGASKIGGILIENTIKGSVLQSSIIGVGLNVNQESFGNLGNVSSLKLLTGVSFDIDEVLQDLMVHFKRMFEKLSDSGSTDIEENYHKVLFRKDLPSTFIINKELRSGCIRGVTKSGKLIVEFDGGIAKEFGLKELRLQY